MQIYTKINAIFDFNRGIFFPKGGKNHMAFSVSMTTKTQCKNRLYFCSSGSLLPTLFGKEMLKDTNKKKSKVLQEEHIETFLWEAQDAR